MPIKSFNPYSPSRRFITVSTFEEITTDKPHRPLVGKLQKRLEEKEVNGEVINNDE